MGIETGLTLYLLSRCLLLSGGVCGLALLLRCRRSPVLSILVAALYASGIALYFALEPLDAFHASFHALAAGCALAQALAVVLSVVCLLSGVDRAERRQ